MDSVAGYADDATWFSVEIDTIPVSAGVDFFIAVRMDTSYAISVDRWGEKDYRSYFSTNGMTYSTGIADYGDINLRAKISEEGIDNNAPIASDGLFTTNEDTDYSGTFSASDVEGDSLTYSILDSTVNGTLILSDPISGTFIYSPIENFNGSDNLTFNVSDGILLDTGTVNITVVGLNDAPIISALVDTTIDEDDVINIVLTANDIDEDALTFSGIADTTAVIPSVSEDTLTLSTTDNWNGSSTIMVVVSDGSATDTTSFELTVNAVNDAPPSFALNEQDSVYITMANFDSDSITFAWDESIAVSYTHLTLPTICSV